MSKIKKLPKTYHRPFYVALALGVIGVLTIWQTMAAPNPNLRGDLNNDNVVNLTDLSILLSNFGKTTAVADLDADGKVALADMSILLSNYNKSSTTPPPVTPPTPGDPTVTIDGVKYPNPLTLKNGNAVTSVAAWEGTRRAELLADFKQYVYGQFPEPTNEKFSVATTELGNTRRKIVTVSVTGPNGTGSFPVRVFIPKGTSKPLGTFVMIDHRGSGNDDPGQDSDYFPLARLLAANYAVAYINANDVAPDSEDSYRSKIINLFYGSNAPDNSGRAISAWAWSAIRAMDYLQTDTDIDPSKVAVIGHSRSGKASLWAGAQDTRFAAVITNNSGNTGDKLARRGDAGIGAETISAINGTFPHWFPQTYKAFNNKESSLPVDQHELLALVAPRRVLIGAATGDGNGDPEGGFLAYIGATPVYKLYGLGVNGLTTTNYPPATNTDFRGDAMSYHLRNGDHGLDITDWNIYMRGNIFSRKAPQL